MGVTLDEALERAVKAHKVGQIQEADRIYTAILQAQPKHPDANHNMGVLAVGVGQIEDALPFFKAALEANPSIGQYWLSYTDALMKLGRMAEAKAVFDQAKDKGAGGEKFDQLEQKLAAQELQDPPFGKLQTIIDLYTQGQLQQALSESSQMLVIFPNSVTLLNLVGASNAGLMQFRAAIDSYKQALKIKPNYADTYYNLGNALYDKGDLEEAIESYNEAVSIKPDYAEAYNNLGNVLTDKGDFEAGINCFTQALKIKPNYHEAYNNIGNALRVKGNEAEALDSYEQALRIKPDYADVHNNIGIVLNNRSDPDAAIKSYKQALKIKPDYAEVYNNMGIAFRDKGDFDAAINSYKQALSIKSDYAEVYNNMGVVLDSIGDPEAAIESYKQALKINPNFAETLVNIGAALMNKGNLETAIDSFKRALKIKPDDVDAHNNMGVAMNSMGDPETAMESFKKALEINPNFAEAHRHWSSLNHYKEYDEHIITMQKLYLDPSITNEQRCHLSFALSKAYKDLNQISQSFNYLKIGNELRKNILFYDIKQDIKLFSQLKKSYPSITKNRLQSTFKKNELKPIFILGMPRSGTTLVEQIISSHSEVTGAGELNYIRRFGQSIATGVINANTKVISDFRQSYREALKKRSSIGSIVTDKMPHNFLYVGLILSAFPDAKIIHVYRNPAATCWSNYNQYFSGKGLGYSYDLDDVVTYFGLYKDLMQFWHGHYGDRIYNLNYDSLTVNLGDETRKLIQHLGLGWEDSCLSPQSNKRSVDTASNQQIRQKVYQGSSQQWRKFEPYLDGVFDQLAELS